jgi:hypothetical protein
VATRRPVVARGGQQIVAEQFLPAPVQALALPDVMPSVSTMRVLADDDVANEVPDTPSGIICISSPYSRARVLATTELDEYCVACMDDSSNPTDASRPKAKMTKATRISTKVNPRCGRNACIFMASQSAHQATQ